MEVFKLSKEANQWPEYRDIMKFTFPQGLIKNECITGILTKDFKQMIVHDL